MEHVTKGIPVPVPGSGKKERATYTDLQDLAYSSAHSYLSLVSTRASRACPASCVKPTRKLYKPIVRPVVKKLKQGGIPGQNSCIYAIAIAYFNRQSSRSFLLRHDRERRVTLCLHSWATNLAMISRWALAVNSHASSNILLLCVTEQHRFVVLTIPSSG